MFEYLHSLKLPFWNGRDVSWGLMEAAQRSKGSVSILTAQDLLGLGSEGRMNTPGTTGEQNWTWRMEDLPSPRTLARLRARTQRTGRAPFASPSSRSRPAVRELWRKAHLRALKAPAAAASVEP